MLNLSSIRTYMYCPRKFFIDQKVLEGELNINNAYNEIKNLKIDINDTLNKNLRIVKKEMTLEEVEQTLFENIYYNINNCFNNIELDENLTKTELDEIYNELTTQTKFDIKILSLKVKRTMEILNRNGNRIVDMFFPSCMYSYFMKDNELDIIGSCDKIEIIDGIYYPILFKNTKPPLKGVWDSDAIEIAAESILIEQEFDTEIFVGFVEYQQIGERRPVVVNVNLRKSLFDIIREITEVQQYNVAPKIKINKNKCSNCEYEKICLDES